MQMSYFTAKMHQIRFRLGLRPRPRWGSLQCWDGTGWEGQEGREGEVNGEEGRGGEVKEGSQSHPLAGFEGHTSRGRAGEGMGSWDWRGWDRMGGTGGEGRGGEVKEGSQSHPPLKNPRSATG